MPLIYKKGDLFSDTEADIFCHACNCQHVWGAGVARQFLEKFPEAFEQEGKIKGVLAPGDAVLYECKYPDVLCLYTSDKYGRYKDDEEQILRSTERALKEVAEWGLDPRTVIASPKINAGLFGVPWEKTAELLEAFVRKTGITWVVYEREEKVITKVEAE